MSPLRCATDFMTRLLWHAGQARCFRNFSLKGFSLTCIVNSYKEVFIYGLVESCRLVVVRGQSSQGCFYECAGGEGYLQVDIPEAAGLSLKLVLVVPALRISAGGVRDHPYEVNFDGLTPEEGERACQDCTAIGRTCAVWLPTELLRYKSARRHIDTYVISIDVGAVDDTGSCPVIAEGGVMDGIALCIDSHLVIERAGNKGVGFSRSDVGVDDKKVVSNGRCDGRGEMQVAQQVFCFTGIEI